MTVMEPEAEPEVVTKDRYNSDDILSDDDDL